MANLTYKARRFKFDKPNTTGTLVLTDITAYVNQASLQRAINLLDDSALSDANRSVLTGLAGTTISINGFVTTRPRTRRLGRSSQQRPASLGRSSTARTPPTAQATWAGSITAKC